MSKDISKEVITKAINNSKNMKNFRVTSFNHKILNFMVEIGWKKNELIKNLKLNEKNIDTIIYKLLEKPNNYINTLDKINLKFSIKHSPSIKFITNQHFNKKESFIKKWKRLFNL